jgi:uncharacterized membrane protein
MNPKPENQKGAERKRSFRVFLHATFAVLGWILFAYFWRLVAAVGLSPGARIALTAMAIFLAILLVSTVGWIFHNLRIGRRNRRVGLARTEEKPYEFDRTGFKVSMLDPESMKSARVIEIVVEGSEKNYRKPPDGGDRSPARH